MRMVGALVARFRRNAGLTQRELAERLMVAEVTIASIEQGVRPLLPDLAESLDQVLGSQGAMAVAVANMPEVDLVPLWAAEFLDLEREALGLSSYQNQVLPGLLQTRAYARAVFSNDVPALTRDEIELRVEARIQRQEILHRKDPPRACFILSEAILVDRLGGDAVYTEQLRSLQESAAIPGLTVQVVPLGRTFHAGLSGPFILIETADHQRLAYVEAQRGSQLIAAPDEVSILEHKYAMLRTQALNPQESRDLLSRLLGEQ
ncbi:helix-turn-helix transcriptional regulator [Streptomyces sp. TRM66268-LWL]|uniref:Helix-turn-helix transcriptional regulator n=2 Tax=Streptomyces polyasparticus TaxID=2767826 RepID=A0ABR7SRK6_9ACTN|nr:helix-turn-helix transcriptional regulator [Streptomyces polyasparticus]